MNKRTQHTTCAVLFALILATLGYPALADPPAELVFEQIAGGLNSPTAITHAGDGSGRLFITQRSGQILIHDGNGILPTPFLDIDPVVASGGEQGLLSTAFHPDYETNGFFFVNYINNQGNTIVARFSVSASDPNIADPASVQLVLAIPQPQSNHNGGQLKFGPDGFLYIAMGDGGGSGDPNNLAQNPLELLGKMLRIDVDALPYQVPASNPFVDDATTLDEIWAIGLRNPWRFSFDRLTGDLLIADVGQDQFEEVNFQAAGSKGGENYGWRLMEGNACFDPETGCNDGSLTLPILEYSHAEGCSITGGYRYRGSESPALQGVLLYGDYCSGDILGGREIDGIWQQDTLAQTAFSISTFGEDEDGELYVADLSFGSNGAIYRIATAPLCEIELTEDAYTQGQSATASKLRLTNPSAVPIETELKIWLGSPDSDSAFLNIGADGTLILPAGLDLDFGPLPFLQVDATVPAGRYEFSCRMLDPVSGALLSEDRAWFEVN